jgi:hypothetical protein
MLNANAPERVSEPNLIRTTTTVLTSTTHYCTTSTATHLYYALENKEIKSKPNIILTKLKYNQSKTNQNIKTTPKTKQNIYIYILKKMKFILVSTYALFAALPFSSVALEDGLRGNNHRILSSISTGDGKSAGRPEITSIQDNAFTFSDAAEPVTMTFEEVVDWAREQSEMIKTENNDNAVNQLVDPITATIAAKFFGKLVLTKLGGLGMDKLFGAFGWTGTGDGTSEKLEEINQSLGAIRDKLNEIQRALTLNHADAKFNVAHSATLASISLIGDVTRRVSSAATGENGKLPFSTVDMWAADNSRAASALRTALLDETSGAIHLLLELWSTKHPTADYISVRSQIVDYIDGVRVTMGLAAMNQAWLQEQNFPDPEQNKLIKNYASGVVEYTLGSANTMYNIIGATYPISADRENPFLHTIGQEQALVSADRISWDGEGVSKAVTSVEQDSLIKSLGSVDVDIWNGVTKQDWMNENGFLPFSLDNRDFFESTFFIRNVDQRPQGQYHSVRVFDVKIEGNTFVYGDYDIFSDKCAYIKQCERAASVMRHWYDLVEVQRVKPENQLHYIKNVTMNGYGMPALMNQEYIAQERDGIVVNSRKQEITSSGVQKIILTVVDHYGSKADGAYRAIDPATGKVVMCYFSDSSSVLPADSHTGQVILQAGYMIPDLVNTQDACDMVVRQTTLVDDLEDGEVQIVLDRN